jgi:4-amino-4-deoxy-L-arabinose transferase-like glycosyltransferase
MAATGSATARRLRLPTELGAAPVVVALTVAAGLLRFVWLDAKGLWQDEALTILHVQQGFGGMLHSVIHRETTPPLYFVLAWLWAKVFGSDEAAVRSLSALAGTVTVPVAYLAAKELVSRRAGVATALLVAVNPLLVWYGQEARSYSLLVLLCALSLVCVARSLRAREERLRRAIAWWALVSVAALATHHFAFALILTEAVWLLYRRRGARAVRVAAAAVLAVAVAVLALAAGQGSEERAGWIAAIGLGGRLVQIPGIFLIGFEAPAPLLLAPVAAACAAVGLWLAARARPAQRDGVLLAGGLAALVVVAELALAAIGRDYLLYRNALPALIPALVVLGAGFGARGSGAVRALALVVLCSISVGVVVATAHQPKYRKEVWRDVARALGPAPAGRAIVVTPGGPSESPLAVYLPGTRRMPAAGAAVSEVAVVGAPYRKLGSLADPVTPRPASPPPPPAPGLRLVARRYAGRFTVFTYRSGRAVPVRIAQLERSRIARIDTLVLLQPPSRAPRKP